MDTPQFWTLMESAAAAGGGDQSLMLATLAKNLAALPPAEIASFKERMEELMGQAYTWDLWGAAYIMQGGCSDDMFEYFRAWLLAQGCSIFEAAVKDPQTLATAKLAYDEPESYEFESLLYVPFEVYEEKTGQEMPLPGRQLPQEPAGKAWDEESDDLKQRFPKLWKKHADLWE